MTLGPTIHVFIQNDHMINMLTPGSTLPMCRKTQVLQMYRVVFSKEEWPWGQLQICTLLRFVYSTHICTEFQIIQVLHCWVLMPKQIDFLSLFMGEQTYFTVIFVYDFQFYISNTLYKYFRNTWKFENYTNFLIWNVSLDWLWSTDASKLYGNWFSSVWEIKKISK